MKSELKAKYLMHLAKKRNGEEGFTLIELLVVIIIIGILAAIALPSFLNQANKARQSEASTYVGTMNRGQQAYFLEKNQFGKLTNLELGIKDTKNYTYVSDPFGAVNTTTQYAISKGTPVNAVLKGYAGKTYIAYDAGGTATTLAFLCESPKANAPLVPNITGTVCP